MNVKIYSRKEMEQLLDKSKLENAAVISFYDPPGQFRDKDYKPVDYEGRAERFFMVELYDIDLEILPDYGMSYETYFPEAGALAEYIVRAYKDGLDIICQCEYGESRSSACAAAIRQFFYGDGISVFADYRYYPNQVVYHKVYDALESLKL